MTDTPFWLNTPHRYQAPEGNYFANAYDNEPYRFEFDSWEYFLEELGGYDLDYNMLYRWDYVAPDPDDYDEDEDIPEPALKFCYILQRKGTFMWATLNNPDPKDEAAIRAYLQERWDYVRSIWAPFN